ncbi:heme NO-binding domain-containing protein [Primorskyibacter sedentarius]
MAKWTPDTGVDRMHGLINRTIQCFVRDTYGPQAWDRIALRAGTGITSFESMLVYEDEVTSIFLNACSADLNKPLDGLLEDIGTYLVSHPNTESLRRLLRFGGGDFVEFLQSLDDLPERARLAVSDLELPELELHEYGAVDYRLVCRSPMPGFGHVLVGVLRTMADDYGTLACLDYGEGEGLEEFVEITLFETEYSVGRSFTLGGHIAQPVEGSADDR